MTVNRFMELRSLGGVLGWCLLVASPFAGSALGAPQTHAASRPWSQSISVEHPRAAEAYAANTACAPLTARIFKHVDAIKGQMGVIKKLQGDVAPTLFGMIQKLHTGRYDGRAVERAHEIIARERRLAREVNALLPTLGCETVDIEAEVLRTYVPLDVSGLAPRPDVPHAIPAEVPAYPADQTHIRH